MASFQMFLRNKETGDIRMIGGGADMTPRAFILQQMLGINEATDEVYVAQVDNLDTGSRQVTLTVSKVKIDVQEI